VRIRRKAGLVLAAVLWNGTPVAAQQTPVTAAAAAAGPARAADNYDELYQRYLDAARSTQPGAGTAATPNWVADLFRDPRALRPNDLVTVQVIESISASGGAKSSLSKDSKAGLSLGALFGLEKRLPASIDPTNLVNGAGSTDFKGSGATTRTGELTAVMTARVSEVLPNGDLVLEGVREIDINGDRQIVVLTGVIRPFDISPNNVVLSPQIGQLRIRYFGRGLIKDNLQPGWLVRVLNRIF
jgi:flagellar L-ring protein precursor FlgH